MTSAKTLLPVRVRHGLKHSRINSTTSNREILQSTVGGIDHLGLVRAHQITVKHLQNCEHKPNRRPLPKNRRPDIDMCFREISKAVPYDTSSRSLTLLILPSFSRDAMLKYIKVRIKLIKDLEI